MMTSAPRHQRCRNVGDDDDDDDWCSAEDRQDATVVGGPTCFDDGSWIAVAIAAMGGATGRCDCYYQNSHSV